ncbi:cytoplasm protein [Rhizoctonia solani AG-1 IA]|uniref:Cytoplasm protein n=1 Tax=Thanatephorus cucumeris (strain AG1-IA) TaxID=983506 RepID=L8WYL7_THACA|nr:cytoplasm protein [Rhizoctonia solani AG-1 IA]
MHYYPGKAYVIRDVIHGQYFYPKEDGTGEKCEVSRPLKAGEVGEWILLEGTPATCTNIALHNLYPGEIDLVVSGPNFGRNTASAFTLSSGTIGAAMSGAISRMRSIALSYGTFHHPSPPKYNAPAHALAGRIIKRLWENWGIDTNGLRLNEVDLYNVNIPMVGYGGMLDHDLEQQLWQGASQQLHRAGPDAPPSTTTTPAQPNVPLHGQHQEPQNGLLTPNQSVSTPNPHHVHTPSIPPHLQRSELVFTFSPDMQNLVSPPLDKVPHGTDTWAVHNGKASVTPMRAAFCPGGEGEDIAAGTIWKW